MQEKGDESIDSRLVLPHNLSSRDEIIFPSPFSQPAASEHKEPVEPESSLFNNHQLKELEAQKQSYEQGRG